MIVRNRISHFGHDAIIVVLADTCPREITVDDIAMVERISGSFVRTYPVAPFEDDIRGAAYEALANAAGTFDGRGTFAGYAGQMVKRRMLDERRRLFHLRSKNRPILVSLDALRDTEIASDGTIAYVSSSQ